jgi:transglutaminase superfamily protein
MVLRLRIMAVAAAVPLLMRLRLERLARVLEPRRAPPAPVPGAEEIAAQVEAVLWRHSRLVRRSCLTRGVTRYWFLRRAGLDVALCFGMGHPTGDPAGHCWIVRDGEPYLEPVDPRPIFVETYRVAAG